MSLEQVAALVCATLDRHGISVVLSGGAVVSIYSDDEYVSFDLDFIPTGLGAGSGQDTLLVGILSHWFTLTNLE